MNPQSPQLLADGKQWAMGQYTRFIQNPRYMVRPVLIRTLNEHIAKYYNWLLNNGSKMMYNFIAAFSEIVMIRWSNNVQITQIIRAEDVQQMPNQLFPYNKDQMPMNIFLVHKQADNIAEYHGEQLRKPRTRDQQTIDTLFHQYDNENRARLENPASGMHPGMAPPAPSRLIGTYAGSQVAHPTPALYAGSGAAEDFNDDELLLDPSRAYRRRRIARGEPLMLLDDNYPPMRRY
jgi:hypothetical protein